MKNQIKQEIESCNTIICNLKSEIDFIVKYTKNFQEHFEYVRYLRMQEKQKRKLEIELFFLNFGSPLNLN
jgi:hypothetical protein